MAKMMGSDAVTYIAFLQVTISLISSETLINGVRYGRVTTPFVISEILPALNDSIVTVIQEDEIDRGNFVITTKTAIYKLSASTSSNNSMTLVAGHDTEYGLESGNGTDTRFNGIYGMVQMNGSYLVADHRNYCLRLANGNSSEKTITYAGACGVIGHRDGPADMARFYILFGLRYKAESIYTADNNMLRRFIITRNLVETIHVSENFLLGGFAFGRDPETFEFFVTTNHGVLHVLNQKETWLVGSLAEAESPETASDGQFSGVKFSGPQDIMWLNNNTLVVTSAFETVIKIIDIEKSEVFSICTMWGFDTYDGDITTCQLNYPWSIMVTDKYIYIGEKTTDGGVRRIPYSLTDPQTGGPLLVSIAEQRSKSQIDSQDWDGPEGHIETSHISCDAPPDVRNTKSLISKNATYGVGSLVVYRCRQGYSDTTDGSGSLTCALFNDRAYWVGDEPMCVLSTEIVMVAALSSGLLLTFILLIIFIIHYCKIKRRLDTTDSKQRITHPDLPLPSIPLEEYEDITIPITEYEDNSISHVEYEDNPIPHVEYDDNLIPHVEYEIPLEVLPSLEYYSEIHSEGEINMNFEDIQLPDASSHTYSEYEGPDMF